MFPSQIKKFLLYGWLIECKNIKSILIILFVFAVFFLPVMIAGKTLYPIAEGRSIQFFNDEPSVKNSLFNPAYLDHGATDWIEAPINASANNSIVNGGLPLWNPYSSMGMPILANTNGATVAPLGFFLNFINSESAWNLMYVGRLLFSVLFTFYFLRRLNLGQVESVSGALLFGFSGYAQLHLNMFHFHVDAMLPFLFWSTLNYAQEAKRSSWLFLVSAIIAVVLGGNPQNLVLSCIISTLLYLTLFWTDKKSRNYKTILFYFLAFIVAIGCCTFYGLSFYEMFSRALKYHDGMGSFSLPAESLLGFSFPVFFASPGLGAIYLPYIGFLTIPVIIAGLKFSGQFKLISSFFFVITLLFVLKVVGFPLINWVGSLPILDNILFTKYLSPLYFSFSVLFAISIGELLRNRKKEQIYFLVLISIVLLWMLYAKAFHNQQPNRGFLNGWVLMFVFLVAASPLLARRFPDKKIGFVFAILLCLFGELLFNRLYHTKDLLDSGVAFSTPKFVKFIHSDREHEYDRIFGVGKILMGNQASLYRIHDIRGLSATTDNRYYTFMRDLILGNNLDIHPFTTTSNMYHPEALPILNLLGVKYIIFDDCKQHKSEMEGLLLVHQEMCMEIYKNPNAYERAFIVHDYVEAHDDAEILKKMSDGSIDLAKTAIVSSGSHINFRKVDGVVSDEFAVIDSYNANEVFVKVNMKSPGLLVLSDLFYPGWNVYVNGDKKAMVQVDYALRGVALESGTHIVHFSYEPRFLKLGGLISLIFVFVTMSLFFLFPSSFSTAENEGT